MTYSIDWYKLLFHHLHHYRHCQNKFCHLWYFLQAWIKDDMSMIHIYGMRYKMCCKLVSSNYSEKSQVHSPKYHKLAADQPKIRLISITWLGFCFKIKYRWLQNHFICIPWFVMWSLPWHVIAFPTGSGLHHMYIRLFIPGCYRKCWNPDTHNWMFVGRKLKNSASKFSA